MWFRYGEVRDPLIKGNEAQRGRYGDIESRRGGRTKRAHTLNGDCGSRCYSVATIAWYSVPRRGGLRGYGLTI